LNRLPSSRTHRVDQYAADVLAGKILAGPLVRLACERHERDRARAEAEPGWYQFDEGRANHIFQFIEGCLRLPDVLDVKGEPQAFILLPWQAFAIGSLFGWVDSRGYRRFREGYIEAGKGCGKTPLLAAVGLYGLMMDGERAAEIYAAAADQEQAMIMFRDAVRIGQASPELNDPDNPELQYDGGVHIWQIRHPATMSSFRTFSREGGQKSGHRPHMGLVDELHENPSPETSVKIRAGAKRRPQPMFVEITNSGFDRTSICWQRHEHARKILERAIEDEQLFGYVCSLDEGDDPLEDESCWPKTNPSIGVSVTEEYLRRQVANAKNIQAETNNVLRLNFCVWTQADSRAINIQQWLACKPMPSDDELATAEYSCGCLDMGETDDFTAFGRLWVLRDGRVAFKCRYWIPYAALQRYPDRPYDQWQRQELLTVTEGDVTDYEVVRAVVVEDFQRYGLQSLFYDPKSALETAQILKGHGIDVVKVPQGWALTEAIKRTLALVTAGDICHGDEAILTWMASNLVVTDGQRGDKRIAKERAADKIDGMAALITGIEGAVVRRERVPDAQFQVMVFGGRS
jgi:phage terminase large subunit-like protein